MVGMLSDTGSIRELNEDFIGCLERKDILVYVVADGMGGHNAGEVASKIAVENTIKQIDSAKETEDIEKILVEAIKSSNSEIYELAQQNDQLKGMGTTITSCIIKEDDIVVSNVGDSRCYVVRENGMFKVTKDHSLVQQLIDNGSITEEEALHHPNKNIITRALGTSKKVEVDTFKFKLSDIKKIILCTDGLTNEVSEKEIYDIIVNNSCEESCRQLIELGKTRGARDNLSVIVFEGECNDDRTITS